jgi:hypothetical protein
VGWAQKYPESLLAKIIDAGAETDGVMVESADGQPVTIHIDRDPALFAHVFKSFDAPLPAVDTEQLLQELDFYGTPSESTMPAASAIRYRQAARERLFDHDCRTHVVPNLLQQIAKLMSEELSDDAMDDALHKGRVAPKELHFRLSKPKKGARSEMEVRLEGTWTKGVDKPVIVPPSIMEALETRLRHLGYSVRGYDCWLGEITRRYTSAIELSWA